MSELFHIWVISQYSYRKKKKNKSFFPNLHVYGLVFHNSVGAIALNSQPCKTVK